MSGKLDNNFSESRGCCYWMCKCFYKRKVNNNTNKTRANNEDNQVILHNGGQTMVNNESNYIVQQNLQNQQNEQNEKKEKIIKKFKIETNKEKSKIVSKPSYEANLNNMYNCPICLNYFNHVLKLSCCKNYICLLCSEEYLDTCLRYEFPANCPFCGTADKSIILNDVEERDPIKIYLDCDSPALRDFKMTLNGKLSRLTLSARTDDKNINKEDNKADLKNTLEEDINKLPFEMAQYIKEDAFDPPEAAENVSNG